MPKDKSVAYLIGVLDTGVSPPKFLGVGIHSESSPTMHMGKRFQFVIMEMTANGHYGKARRKLIKYLDSEHGRLYLGWVWDLLTDEDKKEAK